MFYSIFVLEGAGFTIRRGLSSAGKWTGRTIRFLGRSYSNYTITDSEPQILTPEQREEREEKAENHRISARKFKDIARNVSSAIMLPIRWVGQQAAYWADSDSIAQDGSFRIIAKDVAGGFDNALCAIGKGLHDFMVRFIVKFYKTISIQKN